MPDRDARVGACGIYCGGCLDFLAQEADDDELRRQAAANIKKELNLDLSLANVGCEGCWGGIHNAWSASLDCKIRQCVEAKAFTTCAECRAFPCETFNVQFGQAGKHHENIGAIKQRGLQAWLKEMSEKAQELGQRDANNTHRSR